MTGTEAARAGLELVQRSAKLLVGSTDEQGYPNIKAMFKMKADGLETIWFSTNTSSKRVAQFRANPKACVYFVNLSRFKGLMLAGEMEVLTDQETKDRFWRKGFEVYYPLGPTDPDYCVLRFTARRGNYYHGLKNADFAVGARG